MCSNYDYFASLPKSLETWIRIYLEGGEPLLREYCLFDRDLNEFYRQFEDGGYDVRLANIAQHGDFSETEFWNLGTHKLIPSYRYYISCNFRCPESLIEHLFIGDYVTPHGNKCPNMGAIGAYFNNYWKALSVYNRRLDLRLKLEQHARHQFEFSLRYEGIIISTNNGSPITS